MNHGNRSAPTRGEIERDYAKSLWALADQFLGRRNLSVPEIGLAIAHLISKRTGRVLPEELLDTPNIIGNLPKQVSDLLGPLAEYYDAMPGRKILPGILESPLGGGRQYSEFVAKDSLTTIISEALRLDRAAVRVKSAS